MNIEFITKEIASGKEFFEDTEVSSIENAESELKTLIETFNQEEKGRYGKKARLRQFVRIVKKGQEKHHWIKKSWVCDSLSRVIYECDKCFLRKAIPHYSLSRPPKSACHPDRICQRCNKQFVSTDNLEKHNEKYH